VESPNQSYVAGVDHLRALAALLIVGYHGFQLFSGPLALGAPFSALQPEHWLHTGNPLVAVFVEGHTAVALFMVLSGFIFTRAALGRGIRYGAFVRNRLLRIYPLFVLLLVAGACARPAAFDGGAFVQTLLLGANLPGHFDGGAFSAMFWAISVEFQFYLLFPFLLAFFERHGWRWLAGALVVCLVIRAAAVLEGANARDLSYVTLVGRMDQFLVGMALARSMRERPGVWRPSILAAGVALVVAVLFGFHRLGGWPVESPWKIGWPLVEGVAWALFIGGYLATADRLPVTVSRLLAGIGTISYSIYLLHYLVIYQLATRGWLWRATDHGYADALLNAAFVAAPVILAVSALTYAVVERPFLTRRGPYLERPPTAAPPG
jgi:peptidoglycan/LPS O-acetylase OafA/YrhL